MAPPAHRSGLIAPPLVVTGTVPFRTYGSPTGFGNVVFPGTGTPPPPIDPFSFPSTFAERLGATVSGFPGYSGAPRGFYGRGRNTRLPVPYPVYVGGYGYGYDPGYQQPGYQQQGQPNITIVMPPQYGGQQPPPVTINQSFAPESATPSVREYGPNAQYGQPQAAAPSAPAPYGAASAPADEQTLFLIALKDGTVYTAVAYWVQDATLHYVTPQGKHNQVSLDLVDRPTSDRLNQGRSVEFRLPAAR